MNKIFTKENKNRLKIKLRKKLNPYLAPFRRQLEGVNSPFTIISNNCWGGLVYQYYGFSYDTPTVGMYFFAEDYVKFVSNLKHYLEIDIQFISYEQSKYKETLIKKEQTQKIIGALDDVEIVFLHYHSIEEAREKWNRRKASIHWDNLFLKFSEMNQCKFEHMRAFDDLPFENKLILVSQDYGLKSQVIVKEFTREHEVYDDTTSFREGISLSRWLTKKPLKR